MKIGSTNKNCHCTFEYKLSVLCGILSYANKMHHNTENNFHQNKVQWGKQTFLILVAILEQNFGKDVFEWIYYPKLGSIKKGTPNKETNPGSRPK